MGPASPELPFPSHYQRFVISTFAFVEPPGTAVLEGEVRGIPVNPCVGNASVLGTPHPNTPKPTPALTLLPAAQSLPVGKLLLGCSSRLGDVYGGPFMLGEPFWGSPGDAGIPGAPRCTFPAVPPCATWPSRSPAGPPASWECPHVSLGASRDLGRPRHAPLFPSQPVVPHRSAEVSGGQEDR